MIIRQLNVTPGGVSSNDGEALTAFAAAGVDHGAATTGGHAGAKPNFAGALFVMWSESRLHRCLSFKGPAEVPERTPHVKGSLARVVA
jgi:hypothetical protein